MSKYKNLIVFYINYDIYNKENNIIKTIVLYLYLKSKISTYFILYKN